MSLSDILFTLLIGPLKILFELIYVLCYKLTQNPGFSIIGLSLVMNFLLLPLYNQTDAIQLEAIETEKRLKPFVSHIKKTFKGNEQFMMLQTCYRQNHYKPTDALKGISPLLLEIPFFMAAYNYLSNLGLLHEATLGPIRDLGLPDHMLVIGGIAINLLPILMTAINILSSLIYTKGAPLKTKLQLYGMAAIFLVLLYDSPSGLVFYWTLNNLFSLVKNIFLKLKNPKKVLTYLASASGILLLVSVLLFRRPDSRLKYLFVLGLFVILQLPLAGYLLRKKRTPREIPAPGKAGFFLSCGFLAILVGVLIPSAVVNASPAEFVDLSQRNPLLLVLSTALTAAGIFLVWLPVFFTISSNMGKRVLSLGTWLLACIALVDYMFFGSDYGTLSPDLTYVIPPQFTGLMANAALVALVAIAAFLIYKWKPRLISFVCSTLGIAVLVMSLMNIFGIQAGYREITATMGKNPDKDASSIIPLSKGGKNVVILMMDRGINGYVPYLMEEKPELKEQFAGFTYYPNATSFGAFTNVGTPALFGGYDYTPENMNKRNTESLESKQNEALKVMPVLFQDNGFQITVCDPTYAGYQWIPDLSIYDDYPEIDAYHPIEYCSGPSSAAHQARRIQEKNHSFLYYSLMRIAPVAVQPVIYNGGNYNAFEPYIWETVSGISEEFSQYIGKQVRDGLFQSSGIDEAFYRHYTVLDHLPGLTGILNDDRDTFMMMSNDTPHEPCLLQMPDYVPAPKVDNTPYQAQYENGMTVNGKTMKLENEQQIIHYQANMASMLKLGQWFDYLRENEVWDNTRIIIVSDHGRDLGQFENLVWGDQKYQDAQFFSCLLMVKDFGATEFTTDEQFMTVSDVPALAAQGLIRNPVNPFTGNPIDMAPKADPVHILLTEWNTKINNGNTFLDGPWMSVHDDIRDPGNWSLLSPDP